MSSKLLMLVPSVIITKETTELKEVLQIYRDDIPSPDVAEEELICWKFKWCNSSTEALPNSAASAIKMCDPFLFPNVYTLLKIVCTLCVTSCECERSFSVLRRLNNYMRCTMSSERLSALAMIHTHYDMQINLDEFVDIFAKQYPRRLELCNILV